MLKIIYMRGRIGVSRMARFFDHTIGGLRNNGSTTGVLRPESIELNRIQLGKPFVEF